MNDPGNHYTLQAYLTTISKQMMHFWTHDIISFRHAYAFHTFTAEHHTSVRSQTFMLNNKIDACNLLKTKQGKSHTM